MPRSASQDNEKNSHAVETRIDFGIDAEMLSGMVALAAPHNLLPDSDLHSQCTIASTMRISNAACSGASNAEKKSLDTNRADILQKY